MPKQNKPQRPVHLRKAQCDSFDEVLVHINDLYHRVFTLAGQKSAAGLKALGEKVNELELNQEALQQQITELKNKGAE